MLQTYITLCPSCDTRFQVSAEQLQSANGLVRCGQCEALFSAARHLESSPAVTPSPSERVALEPEPLVLSSLPRRRSGWVSTFWTLAAGLMLAGVAAQYGWFERHRLASHPQLAPFYQQLCQQLPCNLQPPADIAAIVNHQLLVRDHPQRQDALAIDLILENRAAFDQPFPAIKLVFQDLTGKPTHARILQPAEYLTNDFTADSLMPRAKTVQLHLEIAAPEPSSPGYQLSLVKATHRSF